MQSVVPRGSMLMGGSTFAVMQSGGHSGHGAAIGATPVAAAAPMAEAMAATAAAAPHVSPPWLPRLVKQMETRKHETVHRLIKTQEKVRHKMKQHWFRAEAVADMLPMGSKATRKPNERLSSAAPLSPNIRDRRSGHKLLVPTSCQDKTLEHV